MLSALQADRVRVTDLAAQILALEQSLLALRAELALTQERLNSYKFPVFTLPNEIVSDIFIHFLPAYPLRPPLVGTLSPTVLTHICRRWRDIALSTPALWRAVVVYDGLRNYDGDVSTSDMWLSRSRCCPLSVEISEDDDPAPSPEVYAAVVSHRARWEYLKIHLRQSDIPIIGSPMPLLRHMDLSILDSSTVDIIECCEAPLLRTAVLRYAASSHIVLPWAQLTALTLRSVFPHECVPVLRQTSNLVYCKLYLVLGDDEIDGLSDVKLPCLTSLVMEDPNCEHITGYINTLIVPGLSSFQVQERFLGGNPIEALASFIAKSGCKLQELRITYDRTISQDPGDSTVHFLPSPVCPCRSGI